MSREWKARRHAPYPSPEASNPRPACHERKWRIAARRIASGWLLLFYWFALATATHWPGEFRAGPPVWGIHRDHIIHAIVYMPLLWLLHGFLAQRLADSFWRRNSLWLAAVIVLAWGLFDEWSQAFFGRTTSYTGDWVGDAAGVLVACGVVLIVGWRQRRGVTSKTTAA
jgi:VanZ family protein